MEIILNPRVLIRTAKKVGSFFGTLLFIIGGIILSSWFGKYMFDDPMLGTLLFMGTIGFSAIVFFAYQQAKYEVKYENDKLIQELTKNG